MINKSRLLGVSMLVMTCIISAGLSVSTQQFASGVSAKIDPLSIDFNSLHNNADSIFEVIDGNDSYIVWNFTTTSGNWAYVFRDGRMAIGSTKVLNINTASTIWEDLRDAVAMLNKMGAGISEDKMWQAWLSTSTYYAPEKDIYHRVTYEFADNFDLNLFVPDCIIKEANLFVSRCDESNGGWRVGDEGQAYAIDGTEIASCSSGYDCCNVSAANVTDKLAPGKHKITASRINNFHVMYISVITSPMPSKNFTLYSDDYVTVWKDEMKKSQTMDDFYKFINVFEREPRRNPQPNRLP